METFFEIPDPHVQKITDGSVVHLLSAEAMNSDTFTQLATAIINLTGAPAPQELVLQNPQSLGANSVDFSSKTLSNASKSELLLHVNDTFVNNMSNSGYYHQNVPEQLFNNEQVPMEDFDPLESFTFWDGETFYCNQGMETGCSVTMPAEEEMTELQGYLIHNEAVAKDDLSQIRDSDLIRNPTLAELNSCRDSAFDCSAENSFLSDDSGYLLSPELLSKSVPVNESNFMQPSPMFSMSNSGSSYVNNLNCSSFSFAESKSGSQSLLSSSCPVPSRVVPYPQYLSPCDERLLPCPQNSPSLSDALGKRKEPFAFESHLPSISHGFSKSIFADKHLANLSVLSTSAPPEVTMSAMSPKVKSESPALPSGLKHTPERSLSGFSSLSLSNDDESGSYFDDSDHDLDEDFSSDEDLYQFDEGDAFSTSWPPNKDLKGQQRKHRYFWQYNLQARGMKTHNLLPLSEERDPYKLNDVKDPVFSEECTLPVKHSGKARKGDGNDLTPNPKKLFSIGVELKKLNKLIYNLNPTDFNVHGKPLSRKEKNKLASRVCRLKKKAQHEANKIKLYGLQQEHKRLLTILYDMKRLIKYKIDHFHEAKKSRQPFQNLEDYLVSHEPFVVAGNTTEFVNEVLEKTSRGEPDGGLGNV